MIDTDEGLKLETSVSKSVNGGYFTYLALQLIIYFGIDFLS